MFSAPTITLPLCFVSEVIQMEKGEYISSLDDEKPVITDACCYNCNCAFINPPNRLFVVVSNFAMIQAKVGCMYLILLKYFKKSHPLHP